MAKYWACFSNMPSSPEGTIAPTAHTGSSERFAKAWGCCLGSHKRGAGAGFESAVVDLDGEDAFDDVDRLVLVLVNWREGPGVRPGILASPKVA